METKNKVALITGITGQDGSYLAEFLIEKGYEVHGVVRRSSSFNRTRIENLYDDHSNKGDLKLHYGDMTDIASLIHILTLVKPREIYNLAAQSHVQVSYDTPIYTSQVDALGVLNMFEAVRALKLNSRIYQASTSEMFSGDPSTVPQSESTPLEPVSPYGAAKVYSHKLVDIYRDAYKMYICSGILFNHESPRRGENFVTKKITMAIKEILDGTRKKIVLGNLDSKRDWGYAKEYVEAMWMMLQQDTPQDFVIATGETHTVREFVQECFEYLRGELGYDLNWEEFVEIDQRFIRPNEVKVLQGDPTKAKEILGWEAKTKFKDLVKIMMEYEIKK